MTGSKLTMADVALFLSVESIESGNWDYVNPKFYEAYPGIMATAKAVKEHEIIKAYYATKKTTTEAEL